MVAFSPTNIDLGAPLIPLRFQGVTVISLYTVFWEVTLPWEFKITASMNKVYVPALVGLNVQDLLEVYDPVELRVESHSPSAQEPLRCQP